MTSKICKKDDIIDILARLPAKSLIRFLCVCKSWSDLITRSSFIITHLNRNVTKHVHSYLLCLHYPDFKPPSDYYYYSDDEDVKQELQWSLFHHETFEHCSRLSHPLGGTENYRVYGSSNGLVCISDGTLNCRSPIHIWNPSVRKFRTLPMSTNSVTFRYVALQFGFHPGANDYKVVRMMRINRDDAFAIEIYSLGTNTWKMVEEIPPWLKCNWNNHEGTFFNGVAYQIIEKGPMFSVMSVDSGSEEFEEFIAPYAICNSWQLYINVYKDQVCLLFSWYCSGEQGLEKIKFWVLQEKRWKEMSPFVYPSNYKDRIIGISIDDELLLGRRDFDTDDHVLYLCNYESKQVRETGIKLAGMKQGADKLLFGVTYIESLVLLNQL